MDRQTDTPESFNFSMYNFFLNEGSFQDIIFFNYPGEDYPVPRKDRYDERKRTQVNG